MSNSNLISQSIIINDEVLNNSDPISDVITIVKLKIRFICENGGTRSIVFELPMSKFMNNDHTYKLTFNPIFTHYLKQSTMFLKGSTQDQRQSIRNAIKMHEYTIIGILHDGKGESSQTYIDNECDDYIDDFFEETIKNNGGYDTCPSVELEFDFPILAIADTTTITSPRQARTMTMASSLDARNINFHSPVPNTSNTQFVVTPDTDESPNTTEDTNDIDEDTTDVHTNNSKSSNINANASSYNPNWRNASNQRRSQGHSNHQNSNYHQYHSNTNQHNYQGPSNHYQGSSNNYQGPSNNYQGNPNIFQGTPNPHGSSYSNSPPFQNQTQNIPQCNVFELAEFGIMTPEEYCHELLNNTLDLKNFMKKDYVPTQGNGSILNWYRRFVSHAMRHGVFIPPFESLSLHSKMGMWYPYLDRRILDRLHSMSQTIHATMINCKVLPEGPDMTRIMNTSCGYIALHNLMRPIHPRLSLTPIVKPQPRCKANENISEYVSRWSEFVLFEFENGRTWPRYQLAQHIINNLPPAHALWIKHHFESLMLAQGHRNDIPPAYAMSMIAYTIDTLIPDNPTYQAPKPHAHHGYHPSRSTSHALTSQSFDDDNHDDENVTSACCHTSHALTTDKQCPLCQSTTHNLMECHKYINYCLCAQYAHKHPSSVNDIVRLHKQPPKMYRPPRSNGNTSHMAQLLPSSSNDIDPEELVMNPQPDYVADPDETTMVAHSIGANMLSDYNEDDDELFDDSIPDDHDGDITSPNRTCISSIGFDFDTRFSNHPLSTIHTAEIIDIPLTSIVHSVQDDTQEQVHAIGGQYDSGANMNTTSHLSLLWNLQKLPKPLWTADAGQTPHQTRYRGYLILPCTRQGVDGYIAIATYYTPTIGVTLLTPHAIRKQFKAFTQWDIRDNGSLASATFSDATNNVLLSFPLYIHNGLHYTVPFVRPSLHQRQAKLPSNFSMSISTTPSFIDTVRIDSTTDGLLYDDLKEFDSPLASSHPVETDVCHALHSRTQYQLWHQRLGHIQPRTLTELHKHVDGIPNLQTPTLLDNCPVCLVSKMRRANSSSTDASRVATQCNQSISIDLSFIVCQSKNSDRLITNQGLKGETCYVLIVDYYSGMVHGKALVNKAPPLEYFNQWLTRFSPDINNKTVRIDQGGELGRCRRVLKLFQDFGYAIEPTGADSSHQNGSVERGHQSVANMVRSLLHGASLPETFWPYAFYHTLFIMNRIPHHNKPSPPITMCTGRRISLEALRVFGCRIYVRLPGERKAKLDNHTATGIFLGYNETMKNIYWFDIASDNIKTASHVRFDEGMADVDDPPPNVRLLQRVEHDDIMPDAAETGIDLIDFQLSDSPFRTIDTIDITKVCQHDTFGFVFNECHIRHRAYVSDILPNTSASRIRNARRKYIGAFVVQIHNTPIYDLADAIAASTIIHNDPGILAFPIMLAPDKYIPVRNRREPLRINALQLRSITDLRNDTFPVHTSHSIAASSPLMDIVPITPEETRIKAKLTRHKLRSLSTWHLWQQAETKQLDAHHAQDMFGPPIEPPPDAIILYFHWRYKIKEDGTRQGRSCCDGSPRAAPALHQADVVTYSSCVELPCLRLFVAISVLEGYYLLLCDAINAFANARGPSKPTYLRVDAAYSDWYKLRFGVTLSPNLVVRANHALQGHPEAGKLFEELANEILVQRLGLRTTTHERNLYCGLFEGRKIYVCRQVDDIAVAAPSVAIGQRFIAVLGQHINLAGNSLLEKFNGIQVEQSSDYARLHAETYIDRLLDRHGWSTPTDIVYTNEPMSLTVYKQLDAEPGPPEHSPEGSQLVQQAGFSYRQLLGELIYAYVICRVDIGYALTKLSQYSQHPALIHFNALKHVALYLRTTRSWGIMYWRPTKINDLPNSTIIGLPIPQDPTLPTFPTNHPPSQLVAYVDASHGTDVDRRSVTGYVISLCGAAVCYRSKVQTATAISSTEAELVASVLAAKAVKYLRSVLDDMDFPQHDATPIYEDNAASILIVNASKPTPRTRHIDIQYFAIQQWKALGQIILLTIAGIINIADALTKALAWMLHHRHARRAMGHHPHQYQRPHQQE